MQKQPSPTNILECRHYFPWEIPFLVRLHHILHCTTTIPKCCRLNKKNRVWLVETAILQKSIACSKAGKRGLGNLISKYRDLQALLITVINRTLTMVLQILIYSAKHRFKGYFFLFSGVSLWYAIVQTLWRLTIWKKKKSGDRFKTKRCSRLIQWETRSVNEA